MSEENLECCLGGTATLHECRGVVEIDLDMRREKESRADVVAGSHQPVEPPAKNRLCFRLVDCFELSRSNSRSPSCVSAWCIRSRPNEARRHPREVQIR